MAKKYAAVGTKLEIGNGDGPPETYTQLAEVRDISGPAVAVDTVETTSHSSPNAWKEFVATLLDGGDVTFEINYDPAEATQKNAANGLIANMVAKTLKDWKLILTDAANSAITFSGYIVEFSPSMAVKSNLTAKLKIRVTGAVTLP